MERDFKQWKYTPILAISPAEMTALEQLPEFSKDELLPLFPLKGWVASKQLEKTLERIEKSIGDRPWIADIDADFIEKNRKYKFKGEEPDIPVFSEVKSLLISDDGYRNWCEFVKNNKNIIPCVMHKDTSQIEKQIDFLSRLGRGVVVRIPCNNEQMEKHTTILKALHKLSTRDVLFIYDFGKIEASFEDRLPLLQHYIGKLIRHVPTGAIATSGSSFPSSFTNLKKGHFSIYERMLFNKALELAPGAAFIYSDRGSARANKQDGGGGTPPPRIDYPLKKDWQFVRREFNSDVEQAKEKRKAAYVEIAKEIISEDYWIEELRLWGTQQIELTASGDEYSIDNPMKSTAVRINIHLFNQLNYDNEVTEIDTDEEWVD